MNYPDVSTLSIRHTDALTRVAGSVIASDPEVRAVGDKMISLAIEANGVGLAAPQIGLPWRLCVCKLGTRWVMMANPELAWRSQEKTSDTEGCLSLPGVRVRVVRSHSMKVVYSVPGSTKTGMLEVHNHDARIVQHELDHLVGVLITKRSRRQRGACSKQSKRKRAHR